MNTFAATEINWWLFGLKVIIRRVSAGHNGQLIALQEEQLINGVIVSILVRVLRISTSTEALLYPSI